MPEEMQQKFKGGENPQTQNMLSISMAATTSTLTTSTANTYVQNQTSLALKMLLSSALH